MRLLIFVIMALTVLASCSSKKIKNEVKEEVAKETPARDNSELYQQELRELQSAQGLTAEQKDRLSTLLLRNRSRNIAIDQEIIKTKEVLFKTLLDEKSSRAKINVLENQLLKLNRKKVRESLASFREAKSIVGKSEYALDRTLNIIDSSNKEIHDF